MIAHKVGKTVIENEKIEVLDRHLFFNLIYNYIHNITIKYLSELDLNFTIQLNNSKIT